MASVAFTLNGCLATRTKPMTTPNVVKIDSWRIIVSCTGATQGLHTDEMTAKSSQLLGS